MRVNSESIRVVFPRSLLYFRVKHLNNMSKGIYIGSGVVASIARFIFACCVSDCHSHITHKAFLSRTIALWSILVGVDSFIFVY